MSIQIKKVLSIVFTLLICSTTLAFASTKKEDQNTTKEKIKVEILYNVKGNTFVDNIVLEDGTKLSKNNSIVKYTPTAKSTRQISDYFNYAAWITRENGVVSLSLEPKNNVRLSSSQRNMAWSILSDKNQGFVTSSYWNNTQTMKWQFECHFAFAKHKAYWNLEPHRYATSYFQVITSGCNP